MRLERMGLKEIRNNPAIMRHLRFDLTKEKISTPTEKFNSEDAGHYFCIYVRNGRACLALLHYYPDGKGTQEPLTSFPQDMILAALKEAGGSIEVNGYYTINHPIEEMLRLGLQTAKDPIKCQHFWGELEKMKSGKQCIGEAAAAKEGSQ